MIAKYNPLRKDSVKFAYILTVEVSPQDSDLLESKVAEIIRDRFAGTAITFVDCSMPADTLGQIFNMGYDKGWDDAITSIAGGWG